MVDMPLISTLSLAGVAILLLVIVILSLIFSVSGVWERIEKSGEGEAVRERITLGQFGPFIVGRRDLAGGHQTFFGLAFANRIWLRRRDFGVSILVKQGFPQEIARQLEGQVMVHLNLQLSHDRLFLNGVVVPYKVEFTHQPPRVTAMHALEPIARSYRRVELVSTKRVANATISE